MDEGYKKSLPLIQGGEIVDHADEVVRNLKHEVQNEHFGCLLLDDRQFALDFHRGVAACCVDLEVDVKLYKIYIFIRVCLFLLFGKYGLYIN